METTGQRLRLTLFKRRTNRAAVRTRVHKRLERSVVLPVNEDWLATNIRSVKVTRVLNLALMA